MNEKTLSLIDLDRMSIDEAQRLPFAVRDRLLDVALKDGRRLLGPQPERQTGLFSDYFEEDMARMLRLRAVRLCCSGFIPIDEKGDVPSLDPRAQFQLVFENIKTAVTKMDSRLDRVVQMNVFLKNMDYWEEMNRVYREYFQCRPIRATIGTQALNRNYQIEIANIVAYKVARDCQAP